MCDVHFLEGSKMTTKDDLKHVYLDTSVILPWFQNMLQNKKDSKGHIEAPKIIQFLVDHPEIEKYISYFTIAEIVEELLFKTDKIKDYMKRLEHVKAFVEVFQLTIPNLSIIEQEESKNGESGILIPAPELLEYTAKIGDVKDAIHVCIAKHEDIYMVTKDDKVGKAQSVYPKIIGMIGFAKAFA